MKKSKKKNSTSAQFPEQTDLVSRKGTDLPSSDSDGICMLLPGRYTLTRESAATPKNIEKHKEKEILQPGRYQERPVLSSPEDPKIKRSRYYTRPVLSPSSSVFNNGPSFTAHKRGRYYKPDRNLLSSTPSDNLFTDTKDKSDQSSQRITASPHSIPKCVKDFIMHDMHRDGSKYFTPPIEASRVDVRHVNHVGRSPLLKEELDPTLFSMDKFVCDSRTNLAYDYNFTEENLYQIHHIARPDLDEWNSEVYETRLDIMQEGRRNQLRMETYYSDIFDRVDKKLEEGENLLKSVIDLL